MLVFDVGSTYIKYAIIAGGIIIEKGKVSTPNGSEIPSFLSKIINDFKDKYLFKEVGISSTGQIDTQKGEVISASDKIPNYTGAKLKQCIFKNTGFITTVLNVV